MPFPLLPTWLATAVTDIKPSFLRQQEIRLVMLDFDNTLIPYTTNEPTEPVKAWLDELKNEGFTVCVVSNSHNRRVPDFCEKYGISCITHAKKPSPGGIQACLSQFRISEREAVMVGDQIYTDTLGGNLAGVRTILVKAIHNHTIWLKLRHVAEMPFIWASNHRRINCEKS